VVPKNCASVAADDPCTACLKRECCSQVSSCGNNSECAAIFDCAIKCDSQNCIDGCVTSHPAGQAAAKAVTDCEGTSTPMCQNNCSGVGSSGTSGGTSGSSGGGPTQCTALPAAASPEYCSNYPDKQKATDCSGTIPPTNCVLSPNGVSVYCCP
jgi:hypothetical protein